MSGKCDAGKRQTSLKAIPSENGMMYLSMTLACKILLQNESLPILSQGDEFIYLQHPAHERMEAQDEVSNLSTNFTNNASTQSSEVWESFWTQRHLVCEQLKLAKI